MRLKPEDLKVGMTIYEGKYNHKSMVFNAPQKTINEHGETEWRWDCVDDNNRLVKYMINEKHSHYGPSIYSQPAYVTTKEWREIDGAENY